MTARLRPTLINWSAKLTANQDDWACYVATIKPTYDHLIRLVGRISGMLILSDGEARSEVLLRMPYSLANLIQSSDEMLKHVGYQVKRLIPVHEEILPQVYPSRTTASGLQVIEVSLADDDFSRVS